MKKILLLVLLAMSLPANAEIGISVEPIFGSVKTDVSIKPIPTINLQNDLGFGKYKVFWELGAKVTAGWFKGNVFWILNTSQTGNGVLTPTQLASTDKDNGNIAIEGSFNSWRFEVAAIRNINGLYVEPFIVSQYNTDTWKRSVLVKSSSADNYRYEGNLTSNHVGGGLALTYPLHQRDYLQFKGFITNRDYLFEVRAGVQINHLQGTAGWTYRVFETGLENTIRTVISGPFVSLGMAF